MPYAFKFVARHFNERALIGV